VLTLDGNVLGIEFPSFDKLRQFLGNRRLGRNGIGSDHLGPAESYPFGRSVIAVEHQGAGFSGCLLGHKRHSARLIGAESFFIHHGYGVGGTDLCTYSTAFAVFHIYLDGLGFTNNGIWTIEPAHKTGGFALSNQETLFPVYHGK